MDTRMVDHLPTPQSGIAHRTRLQGSRVLPFLRSQCPTAGQACSLALLGAIAALELYALNGGF